ncbi:MAG: RHS domain-containing protein [Gammaproteobacteria bacterium]|nr:RHS domain-containing protein [Gammaproteobacteria bacterium]
MNRPIRLRSFPGRADHCGVARCLPSGLVLALTLFLALGMSLATPAHALETVTYYHTNALGSPEAATDETGTVLWRESYESYGLRRLKEPNSATNTRYFTGHPEDSNTGLTYMGARYYDPTIGRFLSTDPVHYQEGNHHTFNRYSYAANNPYKYIDPDGEQFQFNDPNFENNFRSMLNILSNSSPTMSVVIRDLEKSKHVFAVRKRAGGPEAIPANRNNAETHGVGSGSTFYFDPQWSPGQLDLMPGADDSTPLSVLGHELHHLDDHNRGTLNRDTNKKSNIRFSEEEAVLTENRVRRDLGLYGDRTRYSNMPLETSTLYGN